MIEFNDEALRSLYEAKKDMVVMMFVDGMKTDQTVFKRLRASFWREPVLSFGTVNVARAAAWADFAERIGGGPGTIVIWHPMRRKFQKDWWQWCCTGAAPRPVLYDRDDSRRPGRVGRWRLAAVVNVKLVLRAS